MPRHGTCVRHLLSRRAPHQEAPLYARVVPARPPDCWPSATSCTIAELRQHLRNASLKLAALIEGGEAEHDRRVACLNESGDLLRYPGRWAEGQPILQKLSVDG